MELVEIAKAFRMPGSMPAEEHLLRGLKGMRKKQRRKPPRTTMTMGMHFSSPKYKPHKPRRGPRTVVNTDDNATRNIAIGAGGGLATGALLSRR